MNMTEQTRVNRSYKDRLFRFIFNDKKELLDLYNAVNGTNYKDSEEVTINTIDNVIYMTMKNDVSFLISGVLNLYEHQSTWSPNMPYRNLIYTVDLLKGYVAQQHLDVYGSRQLKLPTPQSIVFYNGQKNLPERSILKLSDSFNTKLKDKSLEFQTIVLNINYGQNQTIMQRCKRLHDYSIFIDRVRYYVAKNDNLEKAIQQAIDECINQNVLSDILLKHRGEVLDMILTEYDEQAHIANEKRWSYEDGRKDERENAIQIMIQSFQKLGHDYETVKLQLKEGFQLSNQEADDKMNQYWKKNINNK